MDPPRFLGKDNGEHNSISLVKGSNPYCGVSISKTALPVLEHISANRPVCRRPAFVKY